jgi:hypothetical protein
MSLTVCYGILEEAGLIGTRARRSFTARGPYVFSLTTKPTEQGEMISGSSQVNSDGAKVEVAHWPLGLFRNGLQQPIHNHPLLCQRMSLSLRQAVSGRPSNHSLQNVGTLQVEDHGYIVSPLIPAIWSPRLTCRCTPRPVTLSCLIND